jgi:hypothetical protein
MTNYLTQAQFTRQKAALTRAENTGDPAKIEATVRKTVAEWNDGHYAWPDDWARWQSALDDSRPWNAPHISITSL